MPQISGGTAILSDRFLFPGLGYIYPNYPYTSVEFKVNESHDPLK